METVIEVNGLKKSFGEVLAVDGLDFSVERKTLFAFLGINGAGKSTTIQILSTVLPKDGGMVSVNGFSLEKQAQEIRKSIGMVFQHSVLDTLLSVKENLKIRASFYGLRGKEWDRRLDELTETFDLKDILKRPFGKLSGGQKRRVDIARGLIHKPSILFLDEPTTGLDPQTRINVWEIVNRLREENGMTVFLTTHYMEEADKADKVVIIDKGKKVAEGTPTSLKNEFSGDYVKLYLPETEETTALLKKTGDAFSYRQDCYFVKIKNSTEAFRFLSEHSELRADFEVVKGDMDDVFLNATGKKLSGEEA